MVICLSNNDGEAGMMKRSEGDLIKYRQNLLILALACVLAHWHGLCAAENAATASAGPVMDKPRPFVVFDNMPKEAGVDTSSTGMIPCTIIPIPWKDKLVPDEEAFKEAVHKLAAHPRLLILDIEYVPLSGSNRTEVDSHFRLFINLVKWAHEAAPGHPVGYYGHGLFPEQPGKEYAAETQELIAAVDAFCPSMYNFDDNQKGWKHKLQGLVQQAHRIAPGKPVYPYMWPGYHVGTGKSMHLLTGEHWKFELDTAHECGADGLIIWGNPKAHWKDKSTWWEETLNFMASKPMVQSPTISDGAANPAKPDDR